MAVEGTGGAAGGELEGLPRSGDVVGGKFVVEGVLGSGGMGVVLAARHVQLGQKVAIKILRPDAAASREAIGRFLREARAAVTLQSAHVVRVMDVGTLPGGLPYIVMEHLTGTDLGGLLLERGNLGVEEAVDYVLQAMEAVAEAHALGLVHRDLKPANLFLTTRPDGSGLVKVLDFGISKATEGATRDQSLTATSAVMGSPMYMSPEQLRSSKNVDTRTDIWALGVILYELVAGRCPFEDETVTGLCARIAADPPTPLRQLRADVPPAFEAVVTRCLEKDMRNRPQTVAELAAALRPFASAELQLAVDRVVRIGGPARPPDAAPSSSQVQSGAGRVHSPTGFADTVGATSQNAGTPKKRWSGPLLVAGAVVAVLALGTGAVLVVRSSSPGVAHPDPTGVPFAAATAAATAPASTVVAAVEPPAPPPSAAASPSSAPALPATASAPKLLPRAPARTPPRSAGPGKPPSSDDLLLDRK
jgi:serine/threonine protein kinase